jgi:hypothetical protein
LEKDTRLIQPPLPFLLYFGEFGTKSCFDVKQEVVADLVESSNRVVHDLFFYECIAI